MASNVDLLSAAPVFSLLDAEEKQTLAGLLESEFYRQGQRIFEIGESGDAMYIVVSGHVHVFAEDVTGEKIIVGECDPGEVFGELSLLDGGPRHTTAVAEEASELLRLDRDNLHELFVSHPHAGLDLLTMVGRQLREADALIKNHVTRNANIEEEESLTFGQHIADRVASFGGSWSFIILFTVIIIAWMIINVAQLFGAHFDPYPFILLNLVLSTLAALQAPIIMMSQNRQSQKDRIKSELDYAVNMKAELEIAHLHNKIDHIYQRLQRRFALYEKDQKSAARQGDSTSNDYY